MGTVFQKLAENLPATITAIAVLVTAIGAVIPVWRNQAVVKSLHSKTDELRIATESIAEQSSKIMVQTNGQLEALQKRNRALEEMLRITMTVLVAREKKIPPFRQEDVPELTEELRDKVDGIIDASVDRRSKS